MFVVAAFALSVGAERGQSRVLAVDLEEKRVDEADLNMRVNWTGRQEYDEGDGGCGVLPYLISESQSFVGHVSDIEENFFGDCQDGWTYQTRVFADFAGLRDQGAVAINSAKLGFAHEEIFAAYPGHHLTCVADVAGATTPDAVGWLFPNDGIDAHKEASNLWDVTNAARRWFNFPDENHGFVFKGFNESFPFADAACLSALDGFYLEVKFMAPEPEPMALPIAGSAEDRNIELIRAETPTRTPLPFAAKVGDLELVVYASPTPTHPSQDTSRFGPTATHTRTPAPFFERPGNFDTELIRAQTQTPIPPSDPR